MEQAHRKLVLNNIDVLIRTTEYDSLKAKCIERGLFFQEMIDKIEAHTNPRLKHKALLEKITHRGPTAFQVLLQICQSHFYDAHDLLAGEKFNSVARRNRNGPLLNAGGGGGGEDGVDTCLRYNGSVGRDMRLQRFEETLEPSEYAVIQSDRCHSSDTSACYSMASRNRGVAFIVNIVNFDWKKDERRNGALRDKRNMINLFRGMGFIVYYYQDITYVEMNALIEQLVASPELRQTDCLLFSILSHGQVDNGMEHVEFSDSSFVSTDKIYNCFNNVNCPSLVGKPRVFLFPFCRGSTPDPGLKSNRPVVAVPPPPPPPVARIQSDSSVPRSRLPTINDFLLCYATVPGFEALRDPVVGSWYIESMCKVWAQNAHNKDVIDLLSYVGQDVQKKHTSTGAVQTTSHASMGFHKKLFFNPGYYGNN